MTYWLLESTLVSACLALVAAIFCWRFKKNPAWCHLAWLLVFIRLLLPPIPVIRSLSSRLVEPWIRQAPVAAFSTPVVSPIRGAALERDFEFYFNEIKAENSFAFVDSTWTENEQKQAELLKKKQKQEQPKQQALNPITPERRGWAIRLGMPLYIALVWVLGTLVMLVIQVKRMLSFQRILQFGEKVDPMLDQEMTIIAEKMGVKPPQMRLFPNISAPFIWSLGRPVLLWPEWKSGTKTGDGYRSILAHELAHLKRKDHWFSYLELIGLVLIWWNPLFWLARSQTKHFAEMACDAWAVWCFPKHRRAFAVALVDAAEKALRPSFAVTVLNATPRKSDHFKRRLKMIMKKGFSPVCSKWNISCAFAVLLMVLPSWSSPLKVDSLDKAYIGQLDAALQPIIKSNLALVNAKHLVHEGQLADAISVLEKAVEWNPENQHLQFKLAHLYLMNGNPQMALNTYQNISGIEKDTKGKHSLFLAKIYMDLDEPDTALNYLEKAVQMGIIDANDLVESRFDALSQQDRYLKLTRTALKLQSEMKEAKSLIKENKMSEALSRLQAIHQLVPDNRVVQAQIGYAAIKANEYNVAIKAYKNVLNSEPDNTTALYNTACAYSLKGDTEKALKFLESAISKGFDNSKLVMKDPDLNPIRQHPDFSSVVAGLMRENQLGQEINMAFEQKDYQNALDKIMEAASMPQISQSDQAWLKGKEAMANYYLKNFGAAIEAFEDQLATSNLKVPVNSIYNLACVLALNGNQEQALATLQAALDLGYDDVNNLIKDEDLSSLREAPIFKERVDTLKKEKVLKKLKLKDEQELSSLLKKMEKGEDLGPMSGKLAWAAYSMGRYDQAAKAFQRALDKEKPDGATAYNVACCYALSGDKSSALNWLEKAISLGYKDFAHMRKDTDLDSLRGDTKFMNLVKDE